MRLFAIFPLVCALVALALSLLCLFAGSTPSFLPNAELITLNTSRIGHTPLFNTSDSGNGDPFSSLFGSIENELNQLLGDASSDIAKAFGIHDFYTVHVMNYCEGYYKPNTTVTSEEHPSENITHCSSPKALFHFDPTAVIKSELASGISLSDLNWPSEVEDGYRTLEVASKAMFAFYVISIILTALAILGALIAVFRGGKLSLFMNFGLDILAFISLTIASAVVTTIIDKSTNTINEYLSDLGVAADRGRAFLGMTWAATGVMLLASMLWIAECVTSRRRKPAYPEKSAY